MAKCEFRVTQDEAGDNLVSNVAYSVTRDRKDKKPQGAIVAGTSQPLCQVKMSMIDPAPMCELPDTAGQDCPIAQYTKGEIDLSTANKKLKQLFGQA
jgi:hypothetical protein